MPIYPRYGPLLLFFRMIHVGRTIYWSPFHVYCLLRVSCFRAIHGNWPSLFRMHFQYLRLITKGPQYITLILTNIMPGLAGLNISRLQKHDSSFSIQLTCLHNDQVCVNFQTEYRMILARWLPRSDSRIFYRARRRPIVVDGIGIGIAADNTLLYELHIFHALHNPHKDFFAGKIL